MKKFFTVMLMLAVMLTSTVAMAAFRETIEEGADIGSIKRLAVAIPRIYKVEDAEPTASEFTQIIFDAGKVARCYVISYDEIAANIQRDTGVDIKALNNEEAQKIFAQNVSKYADAFVNVTVANGTKKPQFFFDVFDAKTGELAYTLTTQSGEIGKNAKDYGKACENFYKRFDEAAEKSIKDSGKKSKKDK